MRAFRLLLAMAIVMILVPASSACPSQCKCTALSADTARVDCSYLDLTSIPTLPSNTVELLLMGNELYKLANNSFLSAPFLTKLDLSNNAISTIELGALNGLSSLEFLDLSGNQLDEGDFRNHEMFRGCRMVSELNLSRNRLSAIPSNGLKLLTRLETLRVSDNNLLSPSFGPEFVYLELLAHIDLNGNRFNTIPVHAFQVLKNLRSVNISHCGIKRIPLGLFDDVTTLHTFDVSDNNEINISDLNATIKAVCRSPELSTLRLSNLNITDLSYMLAPLRETENIRVLDLSHNKLSRLDSSDLRPALKLRRLNLSWNRLHNLTSFLFPFLTDLDLSHNLIDTVHEWGFEGAPNIQEINLSHNRLTQFRSDPFAKNLMIEVLDVSYNLISVIHEIIHLELLTKLNLRGNQIEDPDNLFQMYSIQELDISHNLIRRLNADMIKTKLELQSLDLSDNRIEYIPGKTFRHWCPATIDLSNNYLTSMDDWSVSLVQSLNLSNNRIQYISDQALENMNWITDFDLSNNKLTMLPGSTLNDLAGIRSLDLSGNLLSSFMKGPMAALLFGNQDARLEELSLADNGIEQIPTGFFSSLLHLKTLDMSKNLLTAVSSDQLKGPGLLRHLDLSSNKFNSFNKSALQHLVSLRSIDLSGVSWNCECSIVEVKKWMEASEIEFTGYKEPERYVCSAPQSLDGTQLSELSTTDLACSETLMEKTIILIIIGCTSFVILIAAAIIFWQHRWRLKKKLKKQHYRAIYEGVQSQVPPGGNGVSTQSSYHQHHHQHHTPVLQSKMVACPEGHQHSGQAFV